MSGVRIEIACAQCGKPTKEQAGTISLLRTLGKPLLCTPCRDARNKGKGLLYSRAQAANREARR